LAHRGWFLVIPLLLGVGILVVTVAAGTVWIFSLVKPDWFESLPVWGPVTVGAGFFATVILGVALYMGLTVKAIRLNHRQASFLDAVTHELKTPVASLRLHLQTLARRPLSEEQRREMYEAMLEEVDRLDDLTEQLLHAARASSGKRRHSRHEVPLSPLLQECVSRCRARYGLPEESLRLDQVPLVVRGWEAGLRTLIDNLLDNAVKYSDAVPDISVRAYEYGPGRVRVEVKDRGRGVPSGLGRQIYQRFVRGSTGLERSRPGTGLGLYISWTLARAMGGRLGHRPNLDGPGTTFYVELSGWRTCRPS
jgi:two-component system phosphate regulon sensor histidine kinase PhoR